MKATKAKATKAKPAFVGLVELNDWEGEEFGYYWPYTPEAEKALRGMAARYEKEGDESIRLEVLTEEQIKVLDDNDSNGYRDRVSVYRAPPNWDKFVASIAPAGRPISDDKAHPFYKGRGLPRHMRERQWRET